MSMLDGLRSLRSIIVTILILNHWINGQEVDDYDDEDETDLFRVLLPKRGNVWPKPVEEHRFPTFFVYAGNISFHKSSEDKCAVFTKAKERFIKHMETLHSYAHHSHFPSYLNKGPLKSITIEWKEPCKKYPDFEMNESYKLSVKPDVLLEANTIWGVIRGLETLMQLFYIKEQVLIINYNRIIDYPAYKHRGIMIDTARHYIPPNQILMMLEAMAMNKMNVLHWHIIDDESFPYYSKTFPSLSRNGSFYPDMIYNPSVVRGIVNYAAARGIRVIPELSIPDHCASIALTFPDIFVKCKSTRRTPLKWGPLNPLISATYIFLAQIFKDVLIAFPDMHIHLGFKDIDEACWLEDSQVGPFLEKLPEQLRHDALHVIFLEEVLKLLKGINKQLGKLSQPKFIIWQDATVNRSLPTDDLVVQMVKKWNTNDASLNFTTIYSIPWNLGNPRQNFESMYLGIKDLKNISTAIGGEAYLWGYEVDDFNLISTAWPLATAVAEVLWNPAALDDIESYESYECNDLDKNLTNTQPKGPLILNFTSFITHQKGVTINFTSVYLRKEEQICRMLHLGVPTSPGREMCIITPTVMTTTIATPRSPTPEESWGDYSE